MKSKDIIPSVTIEMAQDRHMYNSISVQFRSERLKRNNTMDLLRRGTKVLW